MTLVRCHFANRANLIANRWFDVGPMPVAQQALHAYNFIYMPMAKCQPFSFNGPTLVRHDLLAPSINIYSLDIFYFFYTWCYWLQLTIYSLINSFWNGIMLAFTETNWYCVSYDLNACLKELNILYHV